MTVEAGEPWGRQPGESSAAFAAFWVYAEQPYKGGLPRRSLRKCAEAIGKNSKLVFGWSEKNGWVERAREYDNHIAREEAEAIKAEIKARRRRAGRISDQLTAAGLRKLQNIDLKKLGHKDAANYLALALKFAAAFEAMAPDEGKLNLNISMNQAGKAERQIYRMPDNGRD